LVRGQLDVHELILPRQGWRFIEGRRRSIVSRSHSRFDGCGL
jgi:hypothetical protein